MQKRNFQFFFMVFIFSINAISQDLKNTALYDGNEVFVHKTNNIFTLNSKNYIKLDGTEYELFTRERTRRGPVMYEHFIKINNDSIFSISDAFLKESLGEEKFNSLKHTLDRYPDSKPSLKYITKSGKIIKYYDIKKSTSGRIISEDEFQSYKGNYGFVKRIVGGDYAMDTIIIKPPNNAMVLKEEKRIKDFNSQIGKSAPLFELEDLEGNLYSNQDLLGKTVVINFWFSSCAPCKKEMPELNRIYNSYKNKDVVFLGLSTDSKNIVEKFLSTNSFNYSVIPDAIDIAEKFLVKFYPSNFVINQEGKITYASSDYSEKKIISLEKAIQSSLN